MIQILQCYNKFSQGIKEKNMKKPLSVLFVFVLFIFSYSAFASSEYNRFRRLSCPKVLEECTTIQALEENEYLPPDENDDLEVYIEGILENYTPEELQDICKSCIVAKSRDSKCINRGIKKCRKKLEPTNDLLYN